MGILGAGFIGSLVGDSFRMFSSNSVSFNPALIIGAFLFSTLIGMIAGAIPAYRASRLKPVDALRYE